MVNKLICRLKPKEQNQFYFIQVKQLSTATGASGGAKVRS